MTVPAPPALQEAPVDTAAERLSAAWSGSDDGVDAAVTRAWSLRQDDPAAAEAMLIAAEAALAAAASADTGREHLRARILLGRADCARRLDRQAEADALTEAAADAIAQADTAQAARLQSLRTDCSAALGEALGTLGRLGQIGLEITGCLDLEAVFTTLHRHLGQLLSAPTLYIGLLDKGGGAIDVRYNVEDGQRVPPFRIALDDPRSFSARAILEDREILVPSASETELPGTIPGTRAMTTLLYRPLKAGDRMLGVLSIQSDRPNAYGPRELEIFRTLCAYGAIALANAEAFREMDALLDNLRETQTRLVQHERLASLGELMAGLTHEVSTPIGIVATTAGHLASLVLDARQRLDAGQMKRSELLEFFDQAAESTRLIGGNGARAVDLITSFKEVSADRAKADQREVPLLDYLREVVSMVEPLLRPRGIVVRVEGDQVRCVLSPGLLAQVVTNLLQNTVLHAFDGVRAPEVRILVKVAGPGTLRIEVADNGVGMPPEVRAKAFEPFFTTRRGRGGTGLGLHIVHNIVTGALQGGVDIVTGMGRGTRFVIDLPAKFNAASPGA